MGLDIRWYRQLTIAEPQPESDDAGWDSDMVKPYAAVPHHASRMADLDGDKWYTLEAWGRSDSFRAGSYSGYNRWRAALASAVLKTTPEDIWSSPDQWAGKPFVELIDFSDCEGAIGPAVCAKLAEDFAAHYSTVADVWTSDDARDYLEIYLDFWHAFRMGAQNGMVQFA